GVPLSGFEKRTPGSAGTTSNTFGRAATSANRFNLLFRPMAAKLSRSPRPHTPCRPEAIRIFLYFHGGFPTWIPHPAMHTDQARYDEIFERELLPHIGALQTFAYHLTYNQDDADDLVQETYLKAYRF